MSPTFTYVPSGYRPPTEKPCRTCGKTKPVAEFYERLEQPLWRAGRWHHDCIPCFKAKARAKYHVDPLASAANKRRRVRQLATRRKAQFRPSLSTTPSPEQLFAKRWPKIRKAHMKSWVHYSMPRVRPVHSFRQLAYKRQLQASAALVLARLEARDHDPSIPTFDPASDGHLSDWLAVQRSEIWSDTRTSPAIRAQKLDALRRAYAE